MANLNRTGFFPVGTQTGSPWNASVKRYLANTLVTNICVGSLCSFNSDGTGTIVSYGATADTNILGVCVGIEPVKKTTNNVQGTSLSLEKIYLEKTSSAPVQYVRVTTNPHIVLEAVTGNGTAITLANIGETYGYLGTAGDQQSPAKYPRGSGVVDIGNPLINATGQFILYDIPDIADNDLASANTRVHVILGQSMTHAGKAVPGK